MPSSEPPSIAPANGAHSIPFHSIPFQQPKRYTGRHCSKPADGYMMVGGYSMEWCQPTAWRNWLLTAAIYGALVVMICLFTTLSETFDTADLVLNSLQNLALIFSLQFACK